MQIYTIGHSNHTWESFLLLLKEHGITLLVDTRSKPVSSYAPFSNIRVLPGLLEDEGIEYQFMGDSLGGKPNDQSLYDSDGKPDYRKMRSQEDFQTGIRQLIRMADTTEEVHPEAVGEIGTVIMCSEEDPTKCHRRLLLGPALEQQGVNLLHIRATGSIQSSDSLGSKKAYQQQLQGTLLFEELEIPRKSGNEA